MVLTYSETVPMGTPAVDFLLPGVDGKKYALQDFSSATFLVVLFTCNHCPFALAVEDRLIELAHKYKNKGVNFVAISANDAENYPDDSFENMKLRAQEKKYPFMYLYDSSQEIARSYKAQCTPDIYVYNKERKLCYHGRIDDARMGEQPPTTNDLDEALEELLEKGVVSFPQKPSMGCNIKWKQE